MLDFIEAFNLNQIQLNTLIQHAIWILSKKYAYIFL